MVARPNNPVEKARELQRRLFIAAKRQQARRFHALYDRIWRGDVLRAAWRRVRGNRGAAGIDGQTLTMIQQQGVEQFLKQLQKELWSGKYRPQPVRRRYIPKADGRRRPLGIPTVRDRVVQMATKMVIEPIFEADFLDCSYGFRPKRSATQALEVIRRTGGGGHSYVVDADIQGFFDAIDHELLMEKVAQRISDRRVLKLLRQWLRAGVMEDGRVSSAVAGTPQGGVISPLLANLYLHELDRVWTTQWSKLGKLVRYADDFVILCRTRSDAEQALVQVRAILDGLRLQLHPDKTRLVELGLGKEGFDFLGCYLRIVRSRNKGRCYLFRWPSVVHTLLDQTRTKKLTYARSFLENLTPNGGFAIAQHPSGRAYWILRGWLAVVHNVGHLSLLDLRIARWREILCSHNGFRRSLCCLPRNGRRAATRRFDSSSSRSI